MGNIIALGFDMMGIDVPLQYIVPQKVITVALRATRKYRQIASTIRHIGIIEPIIIYPAEDKPGYYRLIEGHLRYDVLHQTGATHAFCLIAKDDEGFTYNHKVNRLSPIQEHYMILKVLDRGVSEEEIATVLDVNVALIRSKRDLLRGICPDAVKLMHEHPFTPGALRVIRKMNPYRQIYVAKHMIVQANYSEKLANQMLLITPPEQLNDHSKPAYLKDISLDTVRRMSDEIENSRIQQEDVGEKLGVTSIQLNRASSYFEKLLKNPLVERHLAKHHPEELAELLQVLAPYRTAKQKKAA